MSHPEPVTDPDDPLVEELAERQWQWRVRHRYDDEAAGRAAAGDLVRGLFDSSRVLRTDDGFVWLGPDGEHTPVHDVRASTVDGVRRLRELATSTAGSPLATSVLPGEPSREAFADDSFRLAATTMRLDVIGPVPGADLADRIEVEEMSAAELTTFLRGAVSDYAAAREAAGESSVEARTSAQAAYDELLPGGRPGPGQHLFTVRYHGESVGALWVGMRWPAQAWVYNVVVDEAWRGRGIGAAAMVHAALLTHESGRRWLGLNVFGQNTHARSLYERLGYVVEEEYRARDR